MPDINRLRSEKDFALLSKSRKSAFQKAVGIKVRENTLPHSRFGVVVGLKVHKRAVQRNLVKRRLREILRKHLSTFTKGYDVMIFGLAPAVKTEFADLEAQVLAGAKKVGLLK